MPTPLPIFVANLNVCVLACKQHGPRPQALCNHNKCKIQDNAADDSCPHSAGSQFERLRDRAGVKIEAGGEAISVAVTFTDHDKWKFAGPALWKELHIWTLTAELSADPIHAWINSFLAKIFCGDCKAHAMKYVADHPPNFGSREKLFAWGVDFHNAVNARIGHRIMPVDEAYRIWSAPAVKPVIVTKGCGECGH